MNANPKYRSALHVVNRRPKLKVSVSKLYVLLAIFIFVSLARLSVFGT